MQIDLADIIYMTKEIFPSILRYFCLVMFADPFLQTVKPFQYFIFVVFPVDQFVDLRVVFQNRFRVFDEPFLDFAPSGKIKSEINHCRVDVLVAEMVFDVGYGRTAHQHVNRAGMAKAVCGVQCFHAMIRKHLFQPVLANSVNAAPSESLSALIDKQPVFKCRHGFWPVFLYISRNQVGGPRPDLNDSEPAAFSENSDAHFDRIKVVNTQSRDFVRPCSGIVQQMKDRVIAEALFSFQINVLEHGQSLVMR